MKIILLILLSIFTINAQTTPLKFKAKIGFINSEDKFERYKFIEDGKKAVFVGKNNIQIWDVENLKPVNNLSFTPTKYDYALPVQKILLLGLIKLEWETVEVDPDGRWFVSFEGEKADKRAVVRDLYDGKQLAILQMPANTNTISVGNDEISLVSKANKDSDETKIGYWNGETLQAKGIISIKDYRFHRRIPGSDKILVGFGKTRRTFVAPINEKSAQMAIFDLRTGAIEREFTAPNLIADDFYYEAQITKDQKFLLAKRDKRAFVWDLAGNGTPKFEIKSDNLKESVEIGEIIDGKLLPATFGKTTRFYELDGNSQPKYEFPQHDYKNNTGIIKFIRDGRFAALGLGNDLEINFRAAS